MGAGHRTWWPSSVVCCAAPSWVLPVQAAHPPAFWVLSRLYLGQPRGSGCWPGMASQELGCGVLMGTEWAHSRSLVELS